MNYQMFSSGDKTSGVLRGVRLEVGMEARFTLVPNIQHGTLLGTLFPFVEEQS